VQIRCKIVNQAWIIQLSPSGCNKGVKKAVNGAGQAVAVRRAHRHVASRGPSAPPLQVYIRCTSGVHQAYTKCKSGVNRAHHHSQPPQPPHPTFPIPTARHTRRGVGRPMLAETGCRSESRKGVNQV
jgi:hypothetical protein